MPLLTVSTGTVPVGNYTGKFMGLETVAENPERKFGAGLRWRFSIDTGPHEGLIVTPITGTAPSVRNGCGKLLGALLGRPLKEGEQVDPDVCLGRRYMIVVATGQEGGTRVEAVIPMPAES
jgi:hypothetical protein